MSNIASFPNRPAKPEVESRWEEIAAYGVVGPIKVALARRIDAMPDLIHVVVVGDSCWTGVEPVASLPDDANGRAIADFTGPAVLRAIEHAEVEFAAQPEAC